ncbi:heat shock 70 kDa 13 [Labeo rohita]|uniref:Heat shock 70 kDa protein 13 n=1 Tax=Labeo rohita TaxID=84645 RepID=A0A498LQ86_LABRO|nr:heat shock 70 kDa 13 [Labeo rohita]
MYDEVYQGPQGDNEGSAPPMPLPASLVCAFGLAFEEGSMDSLYEAVQESCEAQVYTIPSRSCSPAVLSDDATKWRSAGRSISVEISQINSDSTRKKKQGSLPKSVSENEALDNTVCTNSVWPIAKKQEDLLLLRNNQNEATAEMTQLRGTRVKKVERKSSKRGTPTQETTAHIKDAKGMMCGTAGGSRVTETAPARHRWSNPTETALNWVPANNTCLPPCNEYRVHICDCTTSTTPDRGDKINIQNSKRDSLTKGVARSSTSVDFCVSNAEGESTAENCEKPGSLGKKMKAISMTMRKRMAKKHVKSVSEDMGDDTEGETENGSPAEKSSDHTSNSLESLYSGQSSSSGVASNSDVSSNRDSLKLEEEVPYTGQFCGRAKVHTDFVPSPYDTDSLKLKVGDIINIISKPPMGIWTGMLNNKVGNFKFIYVDVLPEKEKEEEEEAPIIRPVKVCKKPRPNTLLELLERLHLEEYASSLLLNGYQTVDDLKHLKERHLIELNVSDPEHRRRLLAASDCLYVTSSSVILALFLAGYLGQQYLPPPKPRVIGLDLGTTFCSVGVFQPGTGEIEVIGDDKGRKSIPSVVSFTPTGVFSGHEGQELSDINPQNTIYDAKRFIGKIFDQETLQKESARYPFKVTYNNGSAEFLVSTNSTFTVTPEFIGSRLLLKMKKMAEKQLGIPIEKAVISVPAEFDERQRNYTIRAANLAGLDILRVINEPTAAAMAYGLHKAEVFNVLVVDLGGGTLDVSLLNKQGGMFLTRAMAGNNKLGGQDFTQRLLQYTIERVRQQYGVPPTLKEDIHLLRQAVEAAKINLTQEPHIHLRVPLHLQTTGVSGAQEEKILFEEKLTRELFDELNADLFQKILAPIETVLIEGHLEKGEVDEIVLVGGSTRIPRIRQLISQYFGKEPNTSVDPDLAVVTGVAIQAGIMGGSWPLQVSAIEIPNRHLRKTNFS